MQSREIHHDREFKKFKITSGKSKFKKFRFSEFLFQKLFRLPSRRLCKRYRRGIQNSKSLRGIQSPEIQNSKSHRGIQKFKIQNSNFKIHNFRFSFSKIISIAFQTSLQTISSGNSKFKITSGNSVSGNSKFKITSGNSKIQNSKFKIQNSEFQIFFFKNYFDCLPFVFANDIVEEFKIQNHFGEFSLGKFKIQNHIGEFSLGVFKNSKFKNSKFKIQNFRFSFSKIISIAFQTSSQTISAGSVVSLGKL